MRTLILVGALSLAAHGALAATNVANVTQLGSVLAFPYVASDGATTETVIRITNTATGDVMLTCQIVDRGGNVTGPFSFEIAGRASVSFGLGLAGYYPGGSGEGFMICWATNDAATQQINFNHLTGTAQIIRYDAPSTTRTVSEYSAWSFAARTGANRDPVGSAGLIKLDGTEYDNCPQYVLGQYSPNMTVAATPGKGTTTFTGARFAVLPCNIDLTNPTVLSLGDSPLTSVTLTILNEYGTSSGSPVACIGSWHEAALPAKPSYATTNTVAFRVESKGGAYGCSGLTPLAVIGSIVETATMDGDPDRAASSLNSCGFRAGFIKWR
jgi:hypothetical protein